VVYPRFASVNRGQGGCYECGRRKSELNRRTPEKEAVAIMLRAGMKPLEPYKNAVTRWKCKCLKCGTVGYPQLNMVNYGQGGCRPCSFVKTGLASRRTEKQAKEVLKKHKLQLIGKYSWQERNSLFPVLCLICNKKSKTSWTTLEKQGRQPGCRTCSRKAASLLQVSEEKHNIVLAEHNLEPVGKYTGASDLNQVRCLICGKQAKIRRSFLLARKKKMQGCMKCAGAKIADPAKIATVLKKAKLKPLKPYPGAHSRWKCKCLKCKRTVYPQFNSLLSGQGGCIYCAEIGFDYKKPALLYIIFHNELASIKVGITNENSKPDRLKQFQTFGWEIHKVFFFKRGIQAFRIEQETLKWLRQDLGLPPHLSLSDMPKTGGQSETVSADTISLLRVQRKVSWFIRNL
jgi:hypothetical protein